MTANADTFRLAARRLPARGRPPRSVHDGRATSCGAVSGLVAPIGRRRVGTPVGAHWGRLDASHPLAWPGDVGARGVRGLEDHEHQPLDLGKGPWVAARRKTFAARYQRGSRHLSPSGTMRS